jgi:hypothetical protein
MLNLNDFPTDNSSSTNLKYDIITSKFMTGIRNHERRTSPVPSGGVVFYLIGAVLELALAILGMVFVGLRWIWKRL